MQGKYIRTETTKEKQRESRLNNPVKYWLGKKRDPFSDEQIQKMKEAAIGNTNSLGRINSIETRIKMSDSHKGDKNRNWKGRINPTNDTIRKSIETKLWREAVFIRDNYTCQKCGDKKGGNLRPHHIKNFAQYPELRFAIDNGITFCNKCHNLFHKIYGFINNTLEQLYEFITLDRN